MQSSFRSDLAIETAQMFQEMSSLQGVRIEEVTGEQTGIRVTRVYIENETGSKQLGKAIGTYITLEVPNLDRQDSDYHREISFEVMEQMRLLVENIQDKKILVAGLGNRQMSPDALGPLVVDHLFVTRHLIENCGKDSTAVKGMGCVSALAPGVMAQTGMETREIILGAIHETKPDLLIVIDALAARSVERLNKTIQITDAGIAPGAGVGNRRCGMNAESMGIPVIAIGIPTVIDAESLVRDALDRVLTENEIRDFFVTPKNIDEIAEQMSFTLSEALNQLFHSGE